MRSVITAEGEPILQVATEGTFSQTFVAHEIADCSLFWVQILRVILFSVFKPDLPGHS